MSLIKRNVFHLAAVLFGVTIVVSNVAAEEPESAAQTEKSIEMQLRSIVQTLASTTADSAEQQARAIDEGMRRLGDISGGDTKRLIAPIVTLEATISVASAEGEKMVAACEAILDATVQKMNPDELITTITPHLSTKNDTARHKYYDLMDRACLGPRTVDFSPIFAKYNADISDPVVVYMFLRSPDDALLKFISLSGMRREDPERKRILLSAREIANTLWKQKVAVLPPSSVETSAFGALDTLSRSERWWARMYAASIVKEHAAFRKPDVIERLVGDEKRVIRETAANAKAGDPN